MKNLNQLFKFNYFTSLLVIFIASLSISSCGEEFSEPSLLNYDGENLTGPNFPPGVYTTAARFPSDMLSSYEGQVLEAIDVFILNQPESARVIIFSGNGSSAKPSTEIARQSINSLNPNSWNRISLNNPVSVEGSEIWIGFDFSVSEETRIIGCDAGPGNKNGDYMFIAGNNLWTTFSNLVPDESINWNIRGVVSSN